MANFLIPLVGVIVFASIVYFLHGKFVKLDYYFMGLLYIFLVALYFAMDWLANGSHS